MNLLRVASNKRHAVDRVYYTFDVYARNRGLCPHTKNHAFYAWIFIGFFHGYLYYAIEGILFGDKMYRNKSSTKFDKNGGGIAEINGQ